MKKIVAILLSIIMMFSFVACGKGKAEKYCSSCGEGISKNVAFCEHCGASVKDVEDTDNSSQIDVIVSDNSNSSETPTSSESKPTSTTSASSTPPSTSSSPPDTITTSSDLPPHTHNYSKTVTNPTCTAQGYTTYTCSCGHTYKDKYTNPTHNYSNYKCTKCNAIDKSNTYNYLKAFLLANGETKGATKGFRLKLSELKIDNVEGEFVIQYDESSDQVHFLLMLPTSSTEFRNAMIILNNNKNFEYTYVTCISNQTQGNTHEIAGIIKANSYNQESPLGYRTYNGPASDELQYSETSRALVVISMISFNNFLALKMPEVSVADFGFTSY